MDDVIELFVAKNQSNTPKADDALKRIQIVGRLEGTLKDKNKSLNKIQKEVKLLEDCIKLFKSK